MNAKIVIIEDDEFSSMLLKKSFSRINYCNVDCYPNAFAFLKYLQTSNEELPKVIIMDYNLPVMNGFQILAYLKRNQSLSKINVILYSGIADEGKKITSLKAGALDFVEKNFNHEILKDFAFKVRNLAKTGNYVSYAH